MNEDRNELLDLLEKISNSITKNQNSAFDYNMRGVVYFKLNKPEEAIQDFTKAIKIAPSVPDFYFNCGDVYLSLEDYIMAQNYYEKGLRLKPDDEEAKYALADIIMRTKNEAMNYYNIGFEYYQNNDLENAIINLEKSLELNPSDLILKNNLAGICFNCGINAFNDNNFNKTKIYWEKGYDFNPNDEQIVNNLAGLYGNLGITNFNNGEVNEAIDNFKKSLNYKKSDVAIKYLATCYEVMQQDGKGDG